MFERPADVRKPQAASKFFGGRGHGPLIRGRWPFILILVFAFLPFGAGPQGAAEGSSLRQFVLVLMFLAATFTLVRFPERWTMLARALPLSFVLLLLYVAISPVWSPDPYVSLKRVIQVVGVALIGLAVVVGGNGQLRMHRLVAPTLGAVMLAAVAFSAAFHDFAFAENGLRAFMGTKNTFGQFAVLCVVFALAKRWIDGKNSPFWPLLAILGLAGLALSRSVTSMFAFFLMAFVFVTVRGLRRVHPSWRHFVLALLLLALATGFAFGLVLGFPSLDDVLRLGVASTGRDLSLSGRTTLWQLMLDQAMRHPWFGTGYGGFWLGMQGPSGQVAFAVKWGYPGQAHNGYIDVFNELGLTGLLLLLVFLVEHSRNLLRLSRIDRPLALLHVAIFILILTLNIAEATLLRTTHPWWIVFVASTFEVAWLCRLGPSPAAAVRRANPAVVSA